MAKQDGEEEEEEDEDEEEGEEEKEEEDGPRTVKDGRGNVFSLSVELNGCESSDMVTSDSANASQMPCCTSWIV
jgi:hypothetical protein